MIIKSLFAIPVLQVTLDLDTEKLTEFAFQIQSKDKRGVQVSNRGGWQSNNVNEEDHEEFINLKKEINHYLQKYQSEVFEGMIFKENVILSTSGMWLNINEKHHYNEWHIHGYSTLSGTYYIKHDGFENGNIVFKHPRDYISLVHLPQGLVKKTNEVTGDISSFTPKSNTLLIFPSWVDHKVEVNLQDDSRISLSFNAQPQIVK